MSMVDTRMPAGATELGRQATDRVPEDVYPGKPWVFQVNYHRPLVGVPYGSEPPADQRCRSLADSNMTLLTCNRRDGHGGRHAAIWFDFSDRWGFAGAAVRAVWGERPDVSRARGVTGDEIARRAGVAS